MYSQKIHSLKKQLNTATFETSFTLSTMETGLRIDYPRSIKEQIFQNYESENLSNSLPLQKTKVQITINGENVFWIKIPKSPNNITLSDIKNQLLTKPRIYGITVIWMYDYFVKTIKNGKVGLEECYEDDDSTVILPLFGDKIELECWSK